MNKLKTKFSILGPGIVYAGAAVGVSHLVQSTRAGAEFGFSLIGVIVLANVVKYPFFEASSRYCAATGDNLLQGYRKIGQWAVLLALLITMSTMFTIQAAVTVVTAGLLEFLTEWSIGTKYISHGLIVFSALILVLGHYKALDRLIKFVVFSLAVTTLLALVVASLNFRGIETANLQRFDIARPSHMAFLIALIGWMPGPLDISLWSSLWSQEKNQQLARRASLDESSFDFKFGYIGTTILAVVFLLLGALIMWPKNQTFPDSAVAFSAQLVQLYSLQLGEWSRPFISFAATATMMSTTLTCLDAFPRVLKACFANLDLKNTSVWNHQTYFLIFVSLGTMGLIQFYLTSMKAMVDMATTISFVVAPIIAILNYMVMVKISDTVFAWGCKTLWLARFGIFLLSLFACYYLLFAS